MAILPHKKVSGFKTGANKPDQQRIKVLISHGVEAPEASAILKIKEAVVASFYPTKKTTKKEG